MDIHMCKLYISIALLAVMNCPIYLKMYAEVRGESFLLMEVSGIP